MRFLAAVILLFGVLTTPASAFYYDGNQLFQDCQDRSLGCVRAVGGYWDMMEALGSDLACVPMQVATGQLVDIFAGFLREYPEMRHRSGAVLFIIAVREHFPCPAR